MWSRRNAAFRYALFGALFGLAFPVFATLSDALIQGLPLNLDNLAQIQKRNVLHWLIDTAPLFLGFFASYAGRRQDLLTHLNQSLNRRIDERDRAISELHALQARLEQEVDARIRDIERRSDHLSAATDVGRAVTSILDSDQLMRQVVELILGRFGLYFVGLFLVDEDRKWAVLRAGTGEAARAMLARGHRVAIDDGPIGRSISNAQARVALIGEKDAVHLVATELPESRSEAVLPLRSRGKVLGALAVHDTRSAAFDTDTLSILQTVADQVAVALDNARLFAESQEAVEALHRAHNALSRQAWTELLRARPGLGFRRDRAGISPVDASTVPDLSVQEPTNGRIVLPVTIRNQVLGTLDARKPKDAREWTQEEVDLIKTLIEQLGVALEDARLYEETNRRAQREQLVSNVTSKIRSAPDIDSILRTTVQEIRRALGVSRGTIRLGTETHLAPPGYPPIGHKDHDHSGHADRDVTEDHRDD